jgi:hypothetical protein
MFSTFSPRKSGFRERPRECPFNIHIHNVAYPSLHHAGIDHRRTGKIMFDDSIMVIYLAYRIRRKMRRRSRSSWVRKNHPFHPRIGQAAFHSRHTHI